MRWFVWQLGVALLLTGVIGGVQAHAVSDPPIAGIQFCQVASAREWASCRWQPVGMPHRWTGKAAEGLVAIYRVEAPITHRGLHAVTVSGLPRRGVLRTPEELARTEESPVSRYGMRYWPQLLPFWVDQPGPRTLILTMVAHPGSVVHLRELHVAPLAEAQARHQALWRGQVLLPMMWAAAAAVTGVVSLIVGSVRGLSGALLRLVGITSLATAARIALNFWADAPGGPGLQASAAHGLLLFIDLMICVIAVTYLRERHGAEHRAVLFASAATLLVALASGGQSLGVWLGAFCAVGVAAVILVFGLARAVSRRRDLLGAGLLAAFSVATAVGLHDLALHLSLISPTAVPLQMHATPALMVVMALLLMATMNSRRKLESALERETQRRQRLVQDLHDGLGSRLVALAFRARKLHVDPKLAQGIDDLMRELRMIHHAVRSPPSTLGAVLADARNAYGEPDHGGLPLEWRIDEQVAGIDLDPEQAIATLRILDESIANAVKHAHPSTIRIRALPGQADERAQLRIEDDGLGEFRPGNAGGLANMRKRARSAGLSLRFEAERGAKVVRIGFPA